ncbi:MAG: transposase [Candidatus Nealsonbacteria bacterium]|nr:transposase [Candidatus Nealsonbacteria bacterium]
MAIKRPKFITGQIYHIFNRGVERRNIFQQISDNFRFIFCLYELNDKKLVKMRDRIEIRKENKKYTGSTGVSDRKDKREPLVEIISFCLMPNHYHLILHQLVDGGISLFMKKLSNGYTGYFNEKYNRKGIGALFQGRFKAVHVEDDRQLMALICYIFTNPLELLEKNWKEVGVKDVEEAVKFLESYRWSSYLDYIGIPNFPSVTKRDFVTEFFGSSDKIKKSVEDWILYKTELKSGFEIIKNIILE